MCAQHEVHVLRLGAGLREPIEVRRLQPVPQRKERTLLVVADARIDEDLAAADLHEPAVHAELELAAGRIVVVRQHPVAMTLHDVRLPVGKEPRRVEVRLVRLFDPGDLRGANGERAHGIFLSENLTSIGALWRERPGACASGTRSLAKPRPRRGP
jgi:hypothetical protein